MIEYMLEEKKEKPENLDEDQMTQKNLEQERKYRRNMGMPEDDLEQPYFTL